MLLSLPQSLGFQGTLVPAGTPGQACRRRPSPAREAAAGRWPAGVNTPAQTLIFKDWKTTIQVISKTIFFRNYLCDKPFGQRSITFLARGIITIPLPAGEL